MKRVVVESPFGTRPDGTRASSAEVAENVEYLMRCLADSLARGEAPFASHAIYPRVLNDASPEQREQGLMAGFAWGEAADLVAVYVDRGVTPGMERGIARAIASGQPVERRRLGGT